MFKKTINIKVEHDLKLNILRGLTKEAVVEILGHGFNDINSNVWRYHLPHRKRFWCYKYVYIYFNENKVYSLMFSVFKEKMDFYKRNSIDGKLQ